ncbi:MAG: hypothetical protein OHK0046_06210 [Anaerolineae bacterium]
MHLKFNHRLFRLVVGFALLLSIVFPSLAQLELVETFSADDGTWSFAYPEGWTTEVDEGLVFVDGEGAFLLVFGPEVVETLVDPASDLGEVLDTIAPLLDYTTSDEKNTGVTEDGRDFAVADLFADDTTRTTLGFALNFSDGRRGVIFAELEDDSDLTFDTVIQIVLSFDATGQGGGAVSSLTDHAGEWQDAIAELTETGMIGSGGSLVFFEDYAFFSGQGRYFTALGRNLPRTDIVMAGELTYTASNATELETCTLLARIVTNNQGTAQQFLQVGLTNDNAVLLLDRFGTGEDELVGEFLTADYALGEPTHFLMLAIDDTLTIYLNGELLMDSYPISTRSGSYGIALTGLGAGARCEGRNIWVYEAPSFEAGVCEISASSQVNTRTGPGTGFDRAEPLSPGTILQAIGRSQGEDGFIWYQLDNENWVREDVISASGDCAGVPAVETK